MAYYIPPNETLIAAFNEWMRRFIEEPERFKSEWQGVKQFLADVNVGREPSYGQVCAAYLKELCTAVYSRQHA